MPRSPYIVPFSYVTSSVERELPEIQRRADALRQAFDARIPPASSDRMRMVALAEVLGTPVFLYVLGHPGPAIIELHSWLERFVLLQIPKRLGRNSAARDEISLLIARKTLGECAEIVNRMGIWTDSDVAFVRRLKKLRDGFSHRNFELLAKALGVTELHSYSDMDSHLARVDCVELILDTMDLIQKLTVRRRPGGRNARSEG
jgi:hypothetical protein